VHEGRAAVVAVSRLPVAVEAAMTFPSIQPDLWGDTSLVLPQSIADRALSDILDGMEDVMGKDRIPMAKLLGRLPVALLALR
jgi:maltooligosyltrehalose synthase